jgi:hypothetical protein
MSKHFMVLACAAIAITACASNGTLRKKDDFKPEYADYAGAPIESFTTFGLDGWSAVSRDKLVVWDGVNKAYLLTVWDSCRDLQFADRIAVTQSTRTISKFEKVLVGDDTCPIKEIRPIDVHQMKADRKAHADAAKAASPTSDANKP